MNMQRTLTWTLCLTSLLVFGTLAAAQAMKPLNEADLMTLVRLNVVEKVIVAQLDKRGVEFTLGEEVIARFKKAGASPGVLDALQRLAAKKKESGPERKMMIWTHRYYKSYDNPLPCEVCINGAKVGTFKSEAQRDIDKYLKKGWNQIALKTTPQEPANDSNGLWMDIGPAYKDPQTDELVMERAYWRFKNSDDWKFKDGRFSHDLGPDVKEVTLTYSLYYAGPAYETDKVKEGDFVLTMHPGYTNYNSSVSATVEINGKPLNSFLMVKRHLKITDLVNPKGENEIRLITKRVHNYVENNDTTISVGGPAEWSVVKKDYQLAPVVEFKCLEGWVRDQKSGQLVSKEKPDADTVERVIKFTLDEPAKGK